MFKKYAVLTAAAATLLLGGCVSQADADAKMARGCEAAARAMIEPKQIIEIKSKQFADEHAQGTVWRRVSIQAIEKDGWIEAEKTYSCLYAQQWGLLRTSHAALLEQLQAGDYFIGKRDGQIIGSMDEFMRLTRSSESAMAQ